MGSQITKELGIYNEEEKIHTPKGSHRFRLLNNDPRSATLGVMRTPIQVECTPTGPKHAGLNTMDVLEKSVSLPSPSISQIEFADEEDSTTSLKHIKSVESENIEVLTNIQSKPEEETSETEISKSNPSPFFKEKSVHELFDVRSPTVEIARTPILVQCTPELFALHSRIESLSFCDVEVHEDDPSAILSEDEQSCQKTASSINKWLFGVNNQNNSAAINNSPNESPRKVAKKQKELNALKKQLFFSSQEKEEPKPKVRTPLGDIQASQLQHSPQMLVRSKQWRNIQEERKRRGITDTENTPPSLPPLSKISSAPGKILDRKRSKINWDEENTMLI